MTDKSDLTDEVHEDDGEKPRSTKGDPHYADKGGHGARHDKTALEREAEKARRRAERKNQR